MPQTAAKKIVSRIYGRKRGQVYTPKDFHDIASHETVRKVLSRLTESGTIRRLLRGIYEYPILSDLFDGPAPPDPNAIAMAIARSNGWTILPTGNLALNLIGLSTQVPAQWQYFSDGPSKTYTWDGGKLSFKHRTNKETTLVSTKTGILIQALKSLGQTAVDDQVLKQLLKNLSRDDLKCAVRESRYATAWVYEVIRKLADMKENSHD